MTDGTRKASLDEVLMVLNDHIGELARVSILVFEDGAPREGEITTLGVLEHWTSDAEIVRLAQEVEADVNRRMGRRVTSWESMRATT